MKVMTPKIDSRLSFWSRNRWRIIFILLLCFVIYFFYMPTQKVQLKDGTVIDLIQYDYNIAMNVMPSSGEKTEEHRLLVKYYSEQSSTDHIHAEARKILPSLFTDADRLGLKTIVLKPSSPKFIKTFPIIVFSHNLRFVKGADGEWKENLYE